MRLPPDQQVFAAAAFGDPACARRPGPGQVHHLPVHVSWLNQDGVHFSVIQRKLLAPWLRAWETNLRLGPVVDSCTSIQKTKDTVVRCYC